MLNRHAEFEKVYILIFLIFLRCFITCDLLFCVTLKYHHIHKILYTRSDKNNDRSRARKSRSEEPRKKRIFVFEKSERKRERKFRSYFVRLFTWTSPGVQSILATVSTVEGMDT